MRELIEEIDEDGSGLLEFGEFCQLAAKFLVEEDEEALKKELKEAFRIYDKEGMYVITVSLSFKMEKKIGVFQGGASKEILEYFMFCMYVPWVLLPLHKAK